MTKDQNLNQNTKKNEEIKNSETFPLPLIFSSKRRGLTPNM